MRLEAITLTGTHVQLEPLRHAHADALLAAADRDRSTFGHTPIPADAPSMERFIGVLLADAERDTALPFVQRRLADGVIVGCTRYLNMLWWPDRTTPAEVEIGGTWLAVDAQRSPINTEAKLLLLTHAFEQLHVFRVAIMTDALNARSRAAIERLGATFEGILRKHRPNSGFLTTPGLPRDTAAYSIVDDEWPAMKQRLHEKLRG
ncbi:MAG: GNAT family protein [Actinomycetota bacterium]